MSLLYAALLVWPLFSGLTPEVFWENHKRLVDLAKGGDTSLFEGVIEGLLARNIDYIGATDGMERLGGAEDESLQAKMRCHRDHASKRAVSSGRRSLVGVEGGGESKLDCWRLRGPELHAIIGTTGKMCNRGRGQETSAYHTQLVDLRLLIMHPSEGGSGFELLIKSFCLCELEATVSAKASFIFD